MTQSSNQEIAPRRGKRRVSRRRRLGALLPSPRRIFASAREALAGAVSRAAPTLLGLAGVAALGGALFGGWLWLTHSSRFALREIRLEGHAHATREALLRRGGLLPGKNLFRLSLTDVERRIAADPWVERVTASRSLPDTVVIRVTERKGVAVLNVGGTLYLVDGEGRPFKRAAVEAGEADGLVVLSGIDRRLVADRPADAAALVRRALGVAELWRKNRERPAVGEVALSRDGFTLYTLEGAVAVALGRPSDPSDAPLLLAMGRFDAVWAALSPEERLAARTIHLESKTRPDRVTVSER